VQKRENEGVGVILGEDFDLVAQLVEHNTFNVGVLGSSPSGITEKRKEAIITGSLFFIY
jgi:hypothetical protein